MKRKLQEIKGELNNRENSHVPAVREARLRDALNAVLDYLIASENAKEWSEQ